MSTTITWQQRLAETRDTVKPAPADKVLRDQIIAREVHAGTDKALLAELTGMGVPQINRIARTNTDAPADADLFAGGSTVVVDDTIVAQTERIDIAPAGVPVEGLKSLLPGGAKAPKAKPAPKAKAPAAGPRKVFQPAPAGGHVPPRSRKIRTTGSTVSFGHASEMGYPKVPVDAHAWVSRCDTHSKPGAPIDSTYERRGDARYQDGTEYCLECASLV